MSTLLFRHVFVSAPVEMAGVSLSESSSGVEWAGGEGWAGASGGTVHWRSDTARKHMH